VEIALKEALGEERMAQILLNNPTGLRLPAEACETRWGGLVGGASQLFGNYLFFLAMIPLVFAEGTSENKIEAMKATCSKGGFIDKHLISYANPKIGRAVFYLSQPYFILELAILDFLHKRCWQPSLAATAHRKDCAMAQTSISPHWSISPHLGHMEPTGAKLNEGNMVLLLSSRLEDGRAWRVRDKANKTRCISDPATECIGISPLRHLYGDLYTDSMKSAITELQNTIKMVLLDMASLLPISPGRTPGKRNFSKSSEATTRNHF
jgi:hypothetical protein